MPLPPLVLDAPSAAQAPPGLFDAATGPLPMPEHMMTSGGLYVQDSCGEVHQYPAACITPPYPAIEMDPVDATVSVYAFMTAWGEVEPVTAPDASELVDAPEMAGP